MRNRTPMPIRIIRYGLLALSLLFAGGILFMGLGNMNEVEADPLADYKTTETTR